MVDVSVPAPARSGMYQADSLILYGVKLNEAEDFGEFDAGENGNASIQLQLYRGGELQDRRLYSVVLAYGYAFEGRCYRLDTNRVFIIKSSSEEDAVGCGFDIAPAAGGPAPVNPAPSYKMWRIRSSEELLEIALNYAEAKTLILDANLPGKRSPNSYAITMALAHRDGRLSRD
ncbi:hypothetical protein [Sinorhizobium meliloti]|uniref:hypothetical protein n=1 Tax=Rhizobium meliloti TaxID=382 RepID=UPI00028615AC|nr:hypothetical protein [Sinorhizobium meliloti]ASP77042.1 hypothetical protein CDO27_02920 [Sinorhizobium meliloti]KKA11614.1 hypothetical protein VP03_23265 [Sinorhizobium meliloti]MQW18755.1 hypothetical protein [Sinorhizobium meliloti]QGJ74252.1 hypothetical protein C3L21_09665 [Sinorhizobium meliloti]QND26775.1 hypothetical protein HB773_10115 [Sinorhizobium meliloti]